MNKTTFGTSLILLMAGLLPAAAYHMDGSFINDPTAPPTGGVGPVTTADWALDTSGVSICESNGIGDDRNPQPVTRNGANGLCTTGENDATGLAPYDDADADLEADQPLSTRWVRLDVCDSLTSARNGAADGPYPYAAGASTAGACVAGVSGSTLTPGPGRTDAHGFTGRVGAFTCTVPTDKENLPVVSTDWALYYRALYAWWTFNVGVPPYTGGDDAGLFHSGDGAGAASNNIDAFHGHATVFPLASRSEVGASAVGSVETSAVAPPAVGMSDNPATGGLGGAGLTTNNCAASPSAPPNGPIGPVVRAPYAGGPGGTITSSMRLCAETWDGFARTIYPCAPPPDCNLPAPLAWLVKVAAADLSSPGGPTPLGDQVVTGTMTCAGNAPVSTTATLPGTGVGLPTAGANANTGNFLVAGAMTCLRTDAALNSLPSDIDSLWVVKCTPDP